MFFTTIRVNPGVIAPHFGTATGPAPVAYSTGSTTAYKYFRFLILSNIGAGTALTPWAGFCQLSYWEAGVVA